MSRQDEQFVEDAMAAVRQSIFDSIAPADFDCDRLKEFFLGLRSESDRGLVVISFTYVEETLDRMMRPYFNERVRRSLFEANGPLGTVSSQIKLAAGLYWISPRSYEALELLRKIRNEFAHNPGCDGFADKKVAGLIATLNDCLPDYSSVLKSHVAPDTRTRFHIACCMICVGLVVDLLLEPRARSMSLPFGFMGGVDWEKLPPLVKDLFRTGAEVRRELLSEDAHRSGTDHDGKRHDNGRSRNGSS